MKENSNVLCFRILLIFETVSISLEPSQLDPHSGSQSSIRPIWMPASSDLGIQVIVSALSPGNWRLSRGEREIAFQRLEIALPATSAYRLKLAQMWKNLKITHPLFLGQTLQSPPMTKRQLPPCTPWEQRTHVEALQLPIPLASSGVWSNLNASCPVTDWSTLRAVKIRLGYVWEDPVPITLPSDCTSTNTEWISL